GVGERSGGDGLYLVTVETGEAVEVAPHRVPAGFGEPQWLPDGESFLVRSSVDRETAALGRYELATGRLEPVLESEWELDCRIDLSGRRLVVVANEDGWSRLELRDPRTLALVRAGPLPGRAALAA